MEEERDPRASMRDPIKRAMTPRALLDSSLPPVVFLSLYTLTSVRTAAVIAAGVALGLAAYRWRRKREVRDAMSGLLGVAIGVALVARTGRASTYFLPGVISGSVIALALFVSVIVRRPLSAVVARLFEERPAEWYARRRVRATHTIVTLAWATVMAARAAFRASFIAQDRATAAGVATILTGWPVTVALLVASVAFIRWRTATDPEPPPEPVDPVEPAPEA